MNPCPYQHKDVDTLFGVKVVSAEEFPKTCVCGAELTFAPEVTFISAPALFTELSLPPEDTMATTIVSVGGPQTSTEYPTCAALAARHGERLKLLDFLDWMELKDIRLDGPSWARTPDSIVLEYFGIDRQKLEKERRTIVAEARKAAEKKA